MKSLPTATVLGMALAALLAGCETPSQPTKTAFDPAAYAPYQQAGTGKISGQAFLKTVGGDVKFGAGDEVTLSPATEFFKELMAFNAQGINPSTLTDAVSKEVMSHSRKATADGNGNFEFTGLPAGEYALEVVITWQVPSQIGLQGTGGLVSKLVTVGDGESVRVVLTR